MARQILVIYDSIRGMPHALTNPTFWGLVLNLVGLIAGILGASLAVYSNRKLKTAREAMKATEDKLFHHMAAEAFAEVARIGVESLKSVRSRDWNSVSEIATRLRLSLGETFGAWSRLIRDNELRNALDGARLNGDLLLDALPVGQQDQIGDERLQQMIGYIQVIIRVSAEIAGRLRAEHLREPEEGT